MMERDQDASLSLKQRVQGSGQFLLSGQFAAYLVQVIDYQQRSAANSLTKVFQRVGLHRQRVVASEIGASGADDPDASLLVPEYSGDSKSQHGLAGTGAAEQSHRAISRRMLQQRVDRRAYQQILVVADVLTQRELSTRIALGPRSSRLTIQRD
jgi:hypothetical protein